MLDGIDQPNPRKLFIDDSVKVIKKAVSEDKDIILTGDFNEMVGEYPKMMAKVLLAGNLVDVHEVKHGNECNITTYIRGRRRVDYCFVTPRLVAHVVRCGFEPFNAHHLADHRGYFVDFCIKGLFNRQIPAIVSAASRQIRSRHPKLNTKYIRNLHKYFTEHNVLRKSLELMHTYDQQKVETLDKVITHGMLHAEQQCKHYQRLP